MKLDNTNTSMKKEAVSISCMRPALRCLLHISEEMHDTNEKLEHLLRNRPASWLYAAVRRNECMHTRCRVLKHTHTHVPCQTTGFLASVPLPWGNLHLVVWPFMWCFTGVFTLEFDKHSYSQSSHDMLYLLPQKGTADSAAMSPAAEILPFP